MPASRVVHVEEVARDAEPAETTPFLAIVNPAPFLGVGQETVDAPQRRGRGQHDEGGLHLLALTKMRVRTFTSTAILLAATAAALMAQPQSRRATTITAIRSYPGFYHQQTVLVVGDIKGTIERATIGTDEGAITLVARELREGKVEARGQLLDVGRMSQDDPRLIPFNLLDRTRAAYQDRWPKPGEELILLLGGLAPPPVAADI